MLWNDRVITIFNRVYDADTDAVLWVSTVCRDVRVIKNKGLTMDRTGNHDASACKVHIFCDKLPSDKVLVDPIIFENLPLDEVGKYYTLGGEFSFFALGDYSHVATMATGFYEYMKKSYPDVFKIRTVDEYLHVMPHYEVGGV